MSGGRMRVDAVVIGGGVVGCAVLWELTRRGVEAILIEAEPDLGEGTSKANSAIVHTGFDSHPGTEESRLLRRAAVLWPAVIETLGVPFLPVGALMLARTDEEWERLESEVMTNATALGVRTELVDRTALRELAPYVTEAAVGALSIPDEAVIDPFWLTRAYAEAAIADGAEVRFGSPVVGLAIDADRAAISLADGTELETSQVFDCAGLRADEIARLAGDDSFAITPRKGQFLVSEETFGVDRIVLPIPGPMGKGMLVTPIVFGGLLLGPTAVDLADKTDRSTDPAERERILASCRSLVPSVSDMVPVRSFAGLRTVSSTGDYILGPSRAGDRLYLVAGIRSTGVSASPAIAEHAVAEACRLRGWDRSEPARSITPAPIEELPPGEVVCLCRSISRGEIEAACRRPTAPRTLDAIKRRSGATFGDCQGNLCALDVAGIIATERGLSLTAIEKHRSGSRLVVGQAADHAGGDPLAELAGTPMNLPETVDAVVIGAGPAGLGVAAALSEAGRTVLLVERRPRLGGSFPGATGRPDLRAVLERVRATPSIAIAAPVTATGILPEGSCWLVGLQDPAGASEVRARAVVLATGGYIQPFEHRAISGPRPAGIVTGDFVVSAANAGVAVGRRALVVGGSAYASAIAGLLRSSGLEACELVTGPVEEVRGDRRLEAVRIAGHWIECDTLVFADRFLPGPFLLRGLGLVDARPGLPAPADAHGRLPLDGLWAAGTCVNPDVDHQASLADGRRVGARVAAELESAAARAEDRSGG